MSEPNLRFERLTSEHDVGRFDCGDEDLNDFLKSDALAYQEHHLAGIYVVFIGTQIVGYFSLSADAIPLEVDEPPKGCGEKMIRTYPALKLGRLAIHHDHQGQGIGSEILKACTGVAMALRIESNVGCRFVTVDAYPDKTDWYMRRGFERNKRYKSRTNTSSLRYDVLN